MFLIALLSRRLFAPPFTWCSFTPPPAHASAYAATRTDGGSRGAVLETGEIGFSLTVLPEDIPAVRSPQSHTHARSNARAPIALGGASGAFAPTPTSIAGPGVLRSRY